MVQNTTYEPRHQVKFPNFLCKKSNFFSSSKLKSLDLSDTLRTKITLDSEKATSFHYKNFGRKNEPTIQPLIEETFDQGNGYNQVVWNSELKIYEEVKLDLFKSEEDKKFYLE